MVDIQVTLPATIERVFAAWTEPDDIEGWLCERAHGRALPGHRLELEWPSLGQSIALDVKELVPGRSLRLAGQVAEGVQLHELELSPTPAGTSLRLRHSAPAAIAHGIESGWRIRLRLLEYYLQRGGQRRLVTVAATCAGSADEIFAHLEAGAKLGGFAAPGLELTPDGLVGDIDDDAIYVLRRFAVSTGSHLLAGQAMAWTGTADLEAHRPALLRAITPPDVPNPVPLH